MLSFNSMRYLTYDQQKILAIQLARWVDATADFVFRRELQHRLDRVFLCMAFFQRAPIPLSSTKGA